MEHTIIYLLLTALSVVMISYWIGYKRLKNCDKLIEAYKGQEEIKDKLISNLNRIIANHEKQVSRLHKEISITNSDLVELHQHYAVKTNEVNLEYNYELQKKEYIIDDLNLGVDRYRKSLERRLNRITTLEEIIKNKE